MSSFLLLSLVLALLVAMAAGQSLSFTQTAPNTAFQVREYAACAQSLATPSSTPTFYMMGGFYVTGSNSSTYTDNYINDVWSSQDLKTWTRTTAAATFPAQAWNGAVVTSSGIVYIGGGGDVNANQNNQVYFSSDATTFTLIGNAPFDPRENAGIANLPNSPNTILVALGNTRNDLFVDDIWLSTDGRGAQWTQQCSGQAAPLCPLLTNGGTSNETGQLHGPALVGLYSGAWVLLGGYGSFINGSTSFISNQVAYSTTNFQTSNSYTAPWAPRGQPRAVIDSDSYVYIYGGVYNLPVSSPSQVYYTYYTDVWFSTNAASSSATWTSLGSFPTLASAGYPGLPYSGNPNNPSSALYTNGVVFNPCFGFRWSAGQKQLVLYSGVLSGFRQNNPTVTPAWAGAYVGSLSVPAPTSGAERVSASVLSIAAIALVAVFML